MHRWLVAVVAILLATPISTLGSSSKDVVLCSSSDLDILPGNWSLSDQACLRVDLGVLQSGTTVFLDLTTDQEIDILLFSANTVEVYQNEQSYRMDSVWQSESVFESFIGQGEWHWTAPTDRGETRWFLILDNLNHPQDGGEGAQGGGVAEISLDGGVITPQQFTLSDSIHRVGAGEYEIAHGPFSVDDGTFVEIHARTMEGFPDILVMTESAFALYSPNVNWSLASRIVSADMLLVTSERYLPWEAADTNDEDIYVIVDNRPGPGGGGAGTSPASVTITITLTPVLEPKITSESTLDSVDVGHTAILSGLTTPNKSGQILDSSYSWDTDGDGLTDDTGPTTSKIWDTPGNYTVRLSVTSVDSRSASSTRVIHVEDNSDPIVNIASEGTILKGFGEQLALTGTFTDNWGIERVDWLLDSEIVMSNNNVSESSSTLILEITNDFSPGFHTASILVTDKSGRSTQEDVEIRFIDVTAPEIAPYEEELTVEVNDPVIFQIFATDYESEKILYTWIFEQGTENEIQLNGPQVIYEFKSEGPHYVVCKVENDEFLQSTAEILVLVEGDDEGSSIARIALAAIAVVVIAILAISILLAFNFAVGRRMSEISDEDVEKPTDKIQTREEQMAMWSTPRPLSFEPPNETPEFSQIELDILDLDDVADSSDKTRITGINDALFEGLDIKPEATEQPPSENRKLRKHCSSCSRPFELNLPQGIDTAYTNCPNCGSEELVSVADEQ